MLIFCDRDYERRVVCRSESRPFPPLPQHRGLLSQPGLLALRRFPHAHSVFPFGDVLHYTDARRDIPADTVRAELRAVRDRVKGESAARLRREPRPPADFVLVPGEDSNTSYNLLMKLDYRSRVIYTYPQFTPYMRSFMARLPLRPVQPTAPATASSS